MNWNPLTWFTRRRPATPKRDAVHDLYFALKDRERQLEESVIDAAPYELISPWAQFYDGARLLFPLVPARMDHRQGADGLLWLSESQLDLVRSYARWLYFSNPYAQAALRGLANYVIATGFAYTVSSRRHANASKSMLRQVNKFVEDFLNRNQWWQIERELYTTKRRDGDCGLRLFPQDDGITQARIVEPDYVRCGPTADPAWAFGVLTDADDRSTKLGYRVFYDQNAYDDVPSEEMFLLTNEASRNARRGVSDFFNVHEILDDSAKLLRAGRQGEAVRQALAYLRQWAAVPPSAIQTLQQSEEDYEEPRVSNTGTKTESVKRVVPGEVLDIPEGMQMMPGPQGNAANMAVNLDASLKAAAVKWNIAPWLLTGDVGANFASALVSESPMTKQMEFDQHVHKQEYCLILTRVMGIGVAQGILPQDTLDLCEVTCEGSPIAARNLKQETEINQVLNQNRLLSRRTWAAREGLDYDAEQDIIREEEPVTPPLDTEQRSTTPGAEYAREVNR